MENGLMSSNRRVRPPSPFHRPGTPGFLLKSLREATGLTRMEAQQFLGLSVMDIKAIELYDAADAFVWSAMESRYELLLSFVKASAAR